MKPQINFHGIVRIEIGELLDFTSPERRGDGKPFVTRDLTLTDAAGKTFTIQLFGKVPSDLDIHEGVDALTAIVAPQGASANGAA